MLKHINVVAAVIKKGDSIFATERGYGKYKGWWEFPGGKIEEGETDSEALIREIKEELDTDISVDKFIKTIEYDYPEFHVSLNCYWCTILSGNLTLIEATSSKWLTKDTLRSVNWLESDLLLLPDIEKEL